ncbi:hypothetical protein [Brevibacterium atlanticum]|uniref:hypothetical protein n=1 Tax=Brevibacterium atlanticum TaxID=2697563 RepID=UPI001D18266E|nr:hypothetical protein [Brevibacterium atlanticum]
MSEKLGYSPNGDQRTIGQDGSTQIENKIVLRSEDYRHQPGEVNVTGAEPVRAFLGLSS